MGLYRLPKIIGKDNKPPFGARINWHHPLSQGLLGAWLLNEGGGNIIYDAVKSTKGIFGSTKEPNWLDTSYGRILDFNGTDDCIEMARNDDGFLGPFSIMMMIRIDSIPSVQILFGKGPNTDTNLLEFRLSSATPPLLQLNRGNGTNYSIYDSNTNSVPLNQYLIVGFTTITGACDADPIFYIDANPAGNRCWRTNAGNCDYSNSPIRIGTRIDGSLPFDGKIVYLYVWNRAITAGEVISLKANPYQMFIYPVWDTYILPAAVPPPTGGKSIFGYDSIFHAGGIIQT